MQNKKNILIIILILAVVLLAYFVFKPKDVGAPIQSDIPVGDTVYDNDAEVKDTYTYTNHGFSIELPKGYVVPVEFVNGRGTYTEIYLPNSIITYVTDVKNEENNLSKFEYKGEEKIGSNTFKIYYNKSAEGYIYWFKQDAVGYAFAGDLELLETIKFVGWSQIEGN